MQQRLFEITHLLTQHGSLTAGQLAERFGVSRRTIYRDIDALSGAGIPVYAEKGRGGGIRMLPDFVLEKTMFTKQEQAQLVAQFESMAALNTPDAQQVADKLAAVFGRRDSWLEVDFAPWAEGEKAREIFRVLRDAILARRVVHMRYTGASGSDSERKVEPLLIQFRGQGWYLHAFCRTRQDFRIFKLSRIHGPTETGEEFAPRALPQQATTVQHGAAGRHMQLRVSGSAAFRVYDEFPAEWITPQPDGGFLVDCHMPDDNWVVGFLLSYGPGVEVVSPPDLRDKVKNSLIDALKKYE